MIALNITSWHRKIFNRDNITINIQMVRIVKIKWLRILFVNLIV